MKDGSIVKATTECEGSCRPRNKEKMSKREANREVKETLGRRRRLPQLTSTLKNSSFFFRIPSSCLSFFPFPSREYAHNHTNANSVYYEFYS